MTRYQEMLCGGLWTNIKYVGLIKDMYNNVMTRVRTSDEDTDDFSIRIELHQGTALQERV